MASSAEDLPSCSKMDALISAEGTTVEDTIINKFPVVLLNKLDPDMVSVNLKTEDMKQYEDNQKSLSKNAMKKNYLIDDDATLSDVSVSVSDDEEMVTTPKVLTSVRRNDGKSGKENAIEVKQKGNVSSEIKKRSSSDRKSESSSRISSESYKEKMKYTSAEKRKSEILARDIKCEMVSTQKTNIQGKDIKKESLTGGISKTDNHLDDSSFKKPKTENTLEKIMPNPVKSTKDKKYNTNARYKLALGPFTESALESESFRKFINLASDCVVSFTKKKTTFGSMNGNVELFFGDFLTLQSAMQRLIQLSVLVDKLWVKGTITCLEIKPLNKDESKNKPKADFSAKLFFQLCTEKRQKLQQLLSNKGRKSEDTKSKCVQLQWIPSSINEEMLSLLFPFSVGVKISGSSQKDLKGPVEIEFENQEWADAVLGCFRDFGVSTNKAYDKLFNLVIKNFTPAKDKSNDKSSVNATFGNRKQITGGINKGSVFQRGRTLNQGRNLSNTKNLATTPARNFGSSNQRNPDNRGLLQNRNDQRKRTFDGASFGQRELDNRDLAVKRIRLGNAVQARELAIAERMRNDAQSQQAAQSDASNDAIRQIALSKGLDPSNPDVIRIIEMQSHLGKLQTLALHQRAEAKSLGLMGVPGQKVVNEHQLQVQHKVLAVKQAQEEAEMRRYQAAVQAQGMRARGFDNAEQAGNSWPQNDNMMQNMEIARRREEEERMKQKEYLADIQRKEIMAERQKQLEDHEMHSRHEMQFQRGAERNPHLVAKYRAAALRDADAFATAPKIQPFGDAPPTSGLLGAAPSVGHAPIVPGKRDEQRNKNLYALHDEPGSSRQGGRMLGNNMPRSKSARQPNVPHDPTPSNRSASRVDRLKPSQTNMAFGQRAQDNRKMQDTTVRSKFSGRRSRWDTEGDVRDLNTVNRLQVEPERNDRPLDFNRPMPRLTTEQAFKQDIERTRAVLSSHGDAVRERSFNPKPVPKIIKPLFEEVRDRHGLPVQFGKNAPKKIPKEIEDERRRNAEMNLNKRGDRFSAGVNDRNARNFGNVNAFGDSWDTGAHYREGASNEEFEENPRSSHVRASRGGLMAQRGGLMPQRGGLMAQRGGIISPTSGIVRDDQRSRLFQRAQDTEVELNKKRAREQIDAFEFETRWRGNDVDQPRTNEIASNRHELLRGHSGGEWREIRERPSYDQGEPEEHFYSQGNQPTYGNNEWNKTEKHSVQKGSGYRVDQEYYEGEQQIEPARRSYGARDKFTRAEEEQVSYDEYEESGDYTGETGFGNEVTFGVYQARGNLGAGRGGHVLRTRGGLGNVGESVRGRGAPGVKRNVQQHGQRRQAAGTGRGLLDVPQEYKHIEAAYFGEGNDESHTDVAGEEYGQYQTHQHQSKGRNGRLLPHLAPPPPPPLLGQRSVQGHGVNFY